MLRKSAAVLAVALCLANANATRADPGPVVSWLINEPASLLDLGLLRLNLYLEKEGVFVQDPEGVTTSAYVDYFLEANRIKIIVNYFEQSIKKTVELREICKRVITRLRRFGYIDPDSGNYGGQNTHSKYAEYFSHICYEIKDAPENYRSRLDKLIVLHVNVNSLFPPPEAMPSVEEDLPTTFCTGPLLSNIVYFAE